MALSTSTGSLAVGASRTFNLSPGSALTLVAPPNCRVTVTETPNTVDASGVGGNASRVHNLQLPQTVTYGPYPMGGTVVVANASNSGGAVTWVRSDALVAESAGGVTSLVSGAGTTFPLGGRVGATVTASGTLPASALGAVTPYNSSSSGTLTLPDAATAWATQPYGLVVVSQKGTGVPSFSAGGSDTLRATSGVAACVQYGMCAAQIISATEWALA